MQYLSQFCIIILFSFLGEVLHAVIPLPIPAAIYGLVLLAAALLTGIVKAEQIRGTGKFLVLLLPLLFVAPLVGIVDNLSLIAENLIPILTVIAVGTAITFLASGWITQVILRRKGRAK